MELKGPSEAEVKKFIKFEARMEFLPRLDQGNCHLSVDRPGVRVVPFSFDGDCLAGYKKTAFH